MSTLPLIEELTLTHKEPHVSTPTGSMKAGIDYTPKLPLTDELHRRTTLYMHIICQKQLKKVVLSMKAAATSKQ